jgi:hypothetical protein
MPSRFLLSRNERKAVLVLVSDCPGCVLRDALLEQHVFEIIQFKQSVGICLICVVSVDSTSIICQQGANRKCKQYLECDHFIKMISNMYLDQLNLRKEK